MKKTVIIPLVLVIVAAISYLAYDAYAAEVTIEGKVVDVTKMLKGQNADVTPADVESLRSKGSPVAVKGNDGKVYFIYTESGANATKRLIKVADKTVSITGAKKVVNGVNIIIASNIAEK